MSFLTFCTTRPAALPGSTVGEAESLGRALSRRSRVSCHAGRRWWRSCRCQLRRSPFYACSDTSCSTSGETRKRAPPSSQVRDARAAQLTREVFALRGVAAGRKRLLRPDPKLGGKPMGLECVSHRPNRWRRTEVRSDQRRTCSRPLNRRERGSERAGLISNRSTMAIIRTVGHSSH